MVDQLAMSLTSHTRQAVARTIAACVFALLSVGCGSRPAVENVQTVDKSAATSVALPERVDEALSAAARFLAARQSPDGAWRSDVYAPFKAGDALTPLILRAMLEAWTKDHHVNLKATDYLAAMVGDDGALHPPQLGLAYSVYTSAGAVIALSRQSDQRLLAARDGWLAYLRERQLTESLGWQSDDPQYGGWGYSADLPHKPALGVPLAPLAEPNLSATVFALEALRAAGSGTEDPAVVKALAFVRRCQNHAADGARDPKFEDGGFFFIQGDSVRNKAGVVGTEAAGRERYASYGSTTADGLRAMQFCGVATDDPAMMAAWQWMARNFSAASHPGEYIAAREGARESLYFYYSQSCAAALAEARGGALPAEVDRWGWAEAIAAALLGRQRPDGSWINVAVDVREDDPLVATSLAVSALADCRRIMAESISAE